MIDDLRRRLAALRRYWQRSLRRRILLGNGVIAILLLVAAGMVALQVRRLVTAVDTLEEARLHVDAAVAVRQQTTDLLASATRLLPDQNATVFAEEVSSRLDALKASQQQMLVIAERVDDPMTAEALESVNGEVTNVTNIADTMVRQAEAEQWHSVVIRVELLTRDQQQVLDAVDTLLDHTQRLEEAALAEVEAAERAVIVYPTAVFGMTLILGLALILQITDGITRPVERLTEGAAQLAAGDFDRRVPEESADEIGQLARAFNGMAEQLHLYYRNLEDRVEERTRALKTSLQVSRQLSTILDEKTLTQEVVDQIQQAFNYYHVHIYLFDVERKYLLMVGGTGEAGQRMLLRGHRLKIGQGLVGRAAARNEVTLVEDVSEAPDWLANPLLPETRTELAVPIVFGGTVQGVLDVQNNVTGRLDSSDADLLQMIAAQVAVALQNARLLAQVQTRAERAARISAIGQRIQRATSIEQVLETAIGELGRALPVNSAVIELKRPRSEQNIVTKDGVNGSGTENGGA